MRLGRVKLNISFDYAVDLDNPEMVSFAQELLEEDIYAFVRECLGPGEPAFRELLTEEEDSDLEESDISDFFYEFSDSEGENDGSV